MVTIKCACEQLPSINRMSKSLKLHLIVNRWPGASEQLGDQHLLNRVSELLTGVVMIMGSSAPAAVQAGSVLLECLG